MRSILVSLVVAATVAAAACDSTRPVDAADRAALTEHEAQWAGRSFHSYVFDYSETQISTNYNVRITVENDTVATVIDLNTGQPPTTPRTWPTMDALFNEADFAVLQGGVTPRVQRPVRIPHVVQHSEQQSRWPIPGEGIEPAAAVVKNGEECAPAM